MEHARTHFPLSWDAQLDIPADVETLVLNDFRTEPLKNIRVVRLSPQDTWESVGRIATFHEAQVVAQVIPDYLHIKHRIQGHLKRAQARSVSLHPSQTHVLPELMRHLPMHGIITTQQAYAQCANTLTRAPYRPRYVQVLSSVWDTPFIPTLEIPHYHEVQIVPGFPLLTQCAPHAKTYHLHPRLSARQEGTSLYISDSAQRFTDACVPGHYAHTPCPCGETRSYSFV